jgi:hypothetical protein
LPFFAAGWSVGKRLVEDPEEIERLAQVIEESWRPISKATKPSEVVITLRGSLDDWSPEKQRELLEHFTRLGITAVTVRQESG